MTRNTQTPDHDSTLRDLYATLQGRHRPEEVAGMLLRLNGDTLDRATRQALDRAAKGSSRYSLMDTAFAAPIAPDAAIATLTTLLDTGEGAADVADDPAALLALLAVARSRLGMAEGHTSFKHDRANRATRATLGLELSRRRYNKLFRLVARLEQEARDLQHQGRLLQLARIAKTTFAAAVPYDAFAADPRTAAATAYLTANLGRRSEFTNGEQARAFDAVVARLLDQCDGAPAAGWLAIAHVFPRADVLARVPESDRLQLLGLALVTLRDTAELLRVAWAKTDINLATMIVRPGNDSSTWNALAGAWNKARDMWIALMQSLGHQATFERFLPGKVLRLMAADVAVWHRLSGGQIHPDTRIWAALPMPWDVLAGRAVCTRAQVEAVCLAVGAHPEQSGWTAPWARTVEAAWQPTPELVHGVTVGHPELAYWLRKIGVFSGQALKLDKEIAFPPQAGGRA